MKNAYLSQVRGIRNRERDIHQLRQRLGQQSLPYKEEKKRPNLLVKDNEQCIKADADRLSPKQVNISGVLQVLSRPFEWQM